MDLEKQGKAGKRPQGSDVSANNIMIRAAPFSFGCARYIMALVPGAWCGQWYVVVKLVLTGLALKMNNTR